MKKLIDGKLYDTDKADRLASWDNGFYGGDFHRCSEDLYVTAKGNYFLYGEGGAMSPYSEPSGTNGRTSGQDIVELTPETAYAWCERTDNVSMAVEEFPEFIKEA